jgi:hypothetical protein
VIIVRLIEVRGRLAPLLVAFGAACVGCAVDHGSVCVSGGEALRDSVAPPALQTRLFPLAVGATWTYHATNAIETTVETLTVDAREPIEPSLPDVLAYRVVLQRAYGATLTSWLEDRGDEVVRHRELAVDWRGEAYGDETFLPGRNLVDESTKHTTLGATWKRQFSDVITDTGGTYSDCKSDAFEVQAVDEVVQVPAGTFSVLRVRRTDTGATTWFARGVGKVKYVNGGNHDELVSYDIPGV